MNPIGQLLRIGTVAAAVISLSANAAPPIIVDNLDAGASTSGSWASATGASSHYGPNSLYASVGGSADSATFTPNLPSAGTYRVEAWNSCYSPRATAVPHLISSDDPDVTVNVNQDSASGICGAWEELGTFPFSAGTSGSVTISDSGLASGSYIGADAVRFTRLDSFSLDFAETDGTNLILQATDLDDTLTTTVTMAWPLDEACPAGGSCASTPLTVATVSGSTVTATLPPGTVDGTYVVSIQNGDQSADLDVTLSSGGGGFAVNGVTQSDDLITFDGTNWVATRPADIGHLSKDNMQPSLGVNCIIALFGTFPSRSSSDPFIGEIIFFGGNFAPRNWAFCDGQLLPISSNSALFSILGTIYGGDGRTSFALPDMRGRVPMHAGNAPGLTNRRLGERVGTETH